MVKANAYGHGDVEIAMALESWGVQTMGVGLIEEGMLLRGMGIQRDLIFFGMMDKHGAKACLEARLTPVLSSWDQLHDLVSVIPQGQTVSVHLKFDTGMHRLGFELESSQKLADFLHSNSSLKLAGIMTHLHSGEDSGEVQGSSFEQLRLFDSVSAFFSDWKPLRHSLNSAGLLGLSSLRHSGVQAVSGVSLLQGCRPGLALYGYAPMKTPGLTVDLRPAMSLRSRLVRVRRIKKGEGVSYSHKWKAAQDTWLGVVPIGYADGYHRLLSSKSEVLIGGARVPIVGNICMDYFMVDLTSLVGGSGAEAFLWKEVTLFGYDSDKNLLGADRLAEIGQTITWEILTSVGERVPRTIKERAAP